MTAYYNEWEPYPAQWLRNLITANLIAPGDVDERSITDVKADDLKGYTQCHFFAGIGGWSYAFRLAGLPDDFPAWSCSLPCPPYSRASIVYGRKGLEDERNYWPNQLELIRQGRPDILFGEQVTDAIDAGWLDCVFDDLEAEGYEAGASCIPAYAVGAPHERERIFFVANTRGIGFKGKRFIQARNAAQKMESAWSEIAGKSSSYLRGTWPIKPGISVLADGIQHLASKLRAYGNAIVPQVAAAFIEAFMECRP